jgi:hypothetical protein
VVSHAVTDSVGRRAAVRVADLGVGMYSVVRLGVVAGDLGAVPADHLEHGAADGIGPA